jgi:hypothetical protein
LCWVAAVAAETPPTRGERLSVQAACRDPSRRDARRQRAEHPRPSVQQRSHRPTDEQHGTCQRTGPRNFVALHAAPLLWRSRSAHFGTARPGRILSQLDPCVSRPAMAETVAGSKPLPPKLKRVLELVYAVEGVVAARVWHWPGRIAVGVRGGSATSPMDLLRRVEAAVASLREPEETWDFGILEDDSTRSPRPGEPSGPESPVSSPQRSPRSPS